MIAILGCLDQATSRLKLEPVESGSRDQEEDLVVHGGYLQERSQPSGKNKTDKSRALRSAIPEFMILVHRIAAFAFAMAIPRCQWRHRCVVTLGKFLVVLYSKPLWQKENGRKGGKAMCAM